MRKVALFSLILALGSGMASAQGSHGSFQEFRKGILSDFNSFRKTILDHYADFLNGEWHEYQSLNGEKRDRTPKPSEAPRVKGLPKATPKQTPELFPDQSSVSAPAPRQTPVRTPKSSPTLTPKDSPIAKKEAQPDKKVAQPTSGGNGFVFDFYELPMQLPDIEYNIAHRLTEPSDFARQWKNLEADRVASRLLPAIKETVKKVGLNDYLTYKLIESYIRAKFPETDDSSRLAAVHYLLANLGYDARIAVTTKGAPLLLLPFEQTIYARNYMMMPEGKYYIFAADDFDMNRLATEPVMTCQLPRDAAKGEKFDLVLGELNIPVSPKPFDLSFGPLHLTGEVNANLMPILYRYPQMPVGDYARSNIQPAMRGKLAQQVKAQLSGMQGDQAVAELLKFMHNVFEYSTDEDFHGFEKPYFVEETLFYPKNDCEDRAIFYTWLLWNALGREAQLISFPGHEAATVRLDNPVEGTGYDYKGETFYVSDPTYIGSTTGMVMPIYSTQTPHVDYTYGKNAR